PSSIPPRSTDECAADYARRVAAGLLVERGMDSETAVARAREVASNVIAPQAPANDREGRFSIDAVRALGETGILGLLLPATVGGSQLGPKDFADVTAILAEADPSVAMVFVMHVLAAAAVAVAQDGAHLSPLHETIRTSGTMTT